MHLHAVKLKKSALDHLKHDEELKPFFIDYVGENLKMNLANFYKTDSRTELKFKREASKSLLLLIKKLEGRVEEDNLYSAIEQVCNHFIQFVFVAGGLISVKE